MTYTIQRYFGKCFNLKTLVPLGQQCLRKYSVCRIDDLNRNRLKDESTTVRGWVKSVRKLKNSVFLDVNDGSCNNSIQVVVPKEKLTSPISYGSSVIAVGSLVTNPKNQIELSVSSIEVVGECDVEEYPFRPKKHYTNEYIRQHIHLRSRTNRFASMLRVRHRAIAALHDYFIQKGFINIHTPILTENDCEGAGEVFTVQPDSTKILKEMGSPNMPVEDIFFGRKVYLSVSGQLHLEAVTRGIGDVYTFGPAFRAENSKSRLHLSEFYMVEAESAFVSSIEDVTGLAEQVIKHVIASILNTCSEDVHLCRKAFDDPENMNVKNFEDVCSSRFTVMSYKDASEILKTNSDRFAASFEPNRSFSKEHELFLVKNNDYKPIFVVDWPTAMKPFYMKQSVNDPTKVLAFDLLCPVVGELCGGSVREDHYQTLKNTLGRLNLEEKLDWYLDLRKFGNVPTGGFGMGFERFLQVLLNISNIKDTLPFPRWPHNCKL